MTRAELHEVRELRKLYRLEVERRRQLEATIHGLTTRHLDGLPRSTSIDSSVERLALLLIEVTGRLHELRERLFNAAVKLTELFTLADVTPDEREILSLRYVTGLSFDEISRQASRSIGSVFKLHRSALNRIVDE